MDIEEKESTVQNEDELKDENETATIEQPSAEEGAEEEVKNEEAEESPKEPTVEEQLVEAQLKIADLNDKYLRLMAEFDNYRKRVMKEKAELIKTAGTKVITTILPVLDDMERAEQNIAKMEDVEALKEGVQLIFDKFMKLLATENRHHSQGVRHRLPCGRGHGARSARRVKRQGYRLHPDRLYAQRQGDKTCKSSSSPIRNIIQYNPIQWQAKTTTRFLA